MNKYTINLGCKRNDYVHWGEIELCHVKGSLKALEAIASSGHGRMKMNRFIWYDTNF